MPYTAWRCLLFTSSYSRRCLRASKFCISTASWALRMRFVIILLSIGTSSSMPRRSIRFCILSPPKMRSRSSCSERKNREQGYRWLLPSQGRGKAIGLSLCPPGSTGVGDTPPGRLSAAARKTTKCRPPEDRLNKPLPFRQSLNPPGQFRLEDSAGMIEADDAVAIQQHDGRGGAGAIGLKIGGAHGHRHVVQTGVELAADGVDVSRFLGGSGGVALRCVAVELGGSDQDQAFGTVDARYLGEHRRFGFAIGAPMRPEKEQHGVAAQGNQAGGFGAQPDRLIERRRRRAN